MFIRIPKTRRKKKKKKPIKVILGELWDKLSQEDKELQKRYHQQRKDRKNNFIFE
jgi:hypothetical protein